MLKAATSRMLTRGLRFFAGAVMWVATAAPTLAIEHDRPAGEPYQLAGKRMVFTTWFWVRPGQPDWQDPKTGGNFPGDANVGPFDAEMKYFEHPFGVRLLAEPAQTIGPVIPRERPWEKMGLAINTIVNDQGKLRAWGSSQDANRKGYTCYFESTDGKTWTRPNLGLVEFEGSKDNNLISYNVGTVFIDPSAAPTERFKAVKHSHFEPAKLDEYKKSKPYSQMATERGSGWYGDCIVGAVSADGLTWTELPDPISIEPSDTQVVAGYDSHFKRYVMFTRSHTVGARADGAPVSVSEDKRHNYVTRRAIGRTASTNFQQFPLSEIIIEAGSDMPPTDTYYTNCFTTVPGAPDHYLLFPAVYHQVSDTTSHEVFASYDTKTWHRAPGPPVVKTGTFGAWDGGCIFLRPNLVELPDGTWAIPYTGYLYPHKYPRGAWAYDAGLATWPRGRLMAIAADEHGEFTTAAFIAPGSKLRINAVTERAGDITIEVASLDGKPIAGRTFADAKPLVGDLYQSTVSWKAAADLGVEAGKPILLRFRMNKARIYGLEFE